MINNCPSWFMTFKKSYIEKYILLVIESYKNIPKESFSVIKKEEDRRTELVGIMRRKKYEFNILFPIAYESGEKSKRMDICCYLSPDEDEYICFECKRFLKNTITSSNFRDEYYANGIRRFEDNEYSPFMNEAGMIAFLESGDVYKLKSLMEKRLPEKSLAKSVRDCSADYSFQYVFSSIHNRSDSERKIELYHIILDLTEKQE